MVKEGSETPNPDSPTVLRIVKWYEESASLLGFAKALDEGGWFEAPKDVLYMLEKPWKYDGEFEVWVLIGRPPEFPTDWDERPEHELNAWAEEVRKKHGLGHS